MKVLFILGLCLIALSRKIKIKKSLHGKWNYIDWKKCDNEIYDSPQIFEVIGQSETEIKSTLGFIVMSIEIHDRNVGRAFQKSQQVMNSTIQAISQLLNNSKITTFTTSQFSIQPYYVTLPDYSQQIEGQLVSNQLTIKTEELDLLGIIIDTAVRNGINRIESVVFDIKPEQKQQIQQDLIELAVKDSIHKARLTLSALGYEIVKIKGLSFIDEQKGQIYPEYRDASKNAITQVISILLRLKFQVYATQQKISQKISVSYVIKEKNSQL